MRANRFAGALAFALAAAVAWPLLAQLLASAVPGSRAAALTWCGLAGLYASALLGPGTSRVGRAAAGVAVAASGLPWLVAGAGLASVVLASAVGLAVLRTGWLRRGRSLRSAVLETAVTALALALFALVTPLRDALDMAAAAWGFYLAQSLWWAVGGGPRWVRADAAGDPFERARRELERLLA